MGVPHGILGVFNTILYENEVQKPQIFQQTISLFPEQSALVNQLIYQVMKFFNLLPTLSPLKNVGFFRLPVLKINDLYRS
jgi:hypothetical protein